MIIAIAVVTFYDDLKNLSVRYIGACCGFEPYHIRAMAEELRAERGKLPEASKKSEFGKNLFMAKKRAELNPKVYKDR